MEVTDRATIWVLEGIMKYLIQAIVLSVIVCGGYLVLRWVGY